VQREGEAAVGVDGEGELRRGAVLRLVSSAVSARREVIWSVARAMPGSAPSIVRSARMVRTASTVFQ
jgi:hypothetical protein